MDNISDPQNTSFPVQPAQVAVQSKSREKIRPVEAIFFLVGVIVLAIASVLVHFHPRPYPFDLQVTETIQGFPALPVIYPIIVFISSLNDPIPSIIALTVWLVGLGGGGLIVRARGGSPINWFQSAASLILTVAIAGGMNFLINTLVARPRPGTFGEPIHVFSHILVNSFPSGHTEHDVAYYGFLLYLSFTPPLRQWRYRWVLLPLQIIAIFDILTIGYSRVLEGEHWLTDVLAGYLSGALWLLMCIVLYRFVTEKIEQRLQAQHTPPAKTILPENSAM